MEILPKYKIGDNLCTIKECKIVEFEVDAIATLTTAKGTVISYVVKDHSYTSYAEDVCFPDRDTLIAQL